VLSDTRQAGITPIRNVLKTQSKGKEKRASVSRTRITSPPQIRHASDFHPEWGSELHYIKAHFFCLISFFPASFGVLTVPASTVTQTGKKSLLTLPQNVAGRGSVAKANNTVGEKNY